MPLPRYIILRGETYHICKPVPLDLHAAFNGRKELITRSLRTNGLEEAVAASHGSWPRLSGSSNGRGGR